MELLPKTKENGESLLAVILQKNMLLVLAAIFLVYMNLFNTLTILPLYVVYSGGSDFEVGLLSTVLTLAAVVLRFFLGPIADYLGRKIPLLAGSFVFGSASLLIWFAPNLTWQVLARVYQAIGMATFLSTGSLAVSDLTPVKYRGSVMGIYRLITVLAFMVGPSLALNLINSYGYGGYFYFNAGICFLSFGLLLFLPDKGRGNKDNLGNLTSILENTKLIFKNSSLVRAYTGIAVIASCYCIIVTYVSIFAGRYAGIDNPGIFFTLYACFGGLAGMLGGIASDSLGRGRVVWPALSLLGLGLVILSLLPVLKTWSLFLGALLAGIGYFGTLPIFIAWIVDEADEKIAATALAFQENAIDGSFALSSFLFGLAATFTSYPLIYLCWGLLTLLSPILITKTIKD